METIMSFYNRINVSAHLVDLSVLSHTDRQLWTLWQQEFRNDLSCLWYRLITCQIWWISFVQLSILLKHMVANWPARLLVVSTLSHFMGLQSLSGQSSLISGYAELHSATATNHDHESQISVSMELNLSSPLYTVMRNMGGWCCRPGSYRTTILLAVNWSWAYAGLSTLLVLYKIPL